jgi:hypothetical protein
MASRDYPFGSTPFGRDLTLPHLPRGNYVPAAPGYDGPITDYATDADGRVESIHPIDSGVQMAMFVQQGELPSSPSTGNTLLQMTELATDRQQAEVESRVRAANPIARYLQEGSIAILRIDSEFRTQTGALLVQLTYRNNITNRIKKAAMRGA